MGRLRALPVSTLFLVGMLFSLALNVQPVKGGPTTVVSAALEAGPTTLLEQNYIYFFDDFNDGVADGWTERLGRWSVIDGEYFTSLGIVENGISTVDNLIITNCTIQTKLRFRDTNVGFRAGIVFRYHDSGHYYSFELSNEYDKAELFYYTPEASGYGYGIASLDYPVQSNVNYTLNVEIFGNTFRGFINGHMVISGIAGNLTDGRVGLRGRRADVFFDDFTVYNTTWWGSTWWDLSWKHRRRVEIRENSGYSLTDFPVDVTFKHDGNAQSDGDDIRVVADWVEIPSYVSDLNSTHATVIFEVNVTASTTKTLYVYYGNPNATAPNYPKVSLDISEGQTGYAIIDDAVYIGWDYTIWAGTAPEVTIWVDYKIDFDRNGDPRDNYDLITDDVSFPRKGGVGRYGRHYYNIGLGDYQGYIQTPIYVDIIFANATLRVYKSHRWVKTTQADVLWMFSPSWDYANYGLGSEQNIIDGKNVTQITPSPPWHYPWNEMYISSVNPKWMAYRDSIAGEIFGSIGLNIGAAYNYCFAAKEGSDWDRCIRYDFTTPEPPPEPYDQPPDCRIYWYGDNSNDYSQIEKLATILNNQPSVMVVPDVINVPNDFSTIQEAINAADQGDIIQVASGTYYEHVVVNKSVTLLGQDPSTTIIDGYGTGTVALLNVSNVVFKNFTVRNGGFNWGVFAYYVDDNSILNSIFSNNGGGIGLHASKNNNIENNTVLHNQWGITLTTNSTGNVIRNNLIMNSQYGLYISQSGYNIFRENSLSNNTINLAFNFLVNLQDFVQDMDTSNTINGKLVYYLVNEHNVTIPSDAGYVGVINSTNISIVDFHITNNGEGLLAVALSESIIRNVTFSHNHCGIVLKDSNDNFVIKNRIEFNGWGVILHRSNDNIFFHDNFIFNTGQISRFESINIWDDGYPSGGNYWSNYNGTDLYSGPYQNETCSDGIGDTPYTIDENNTDNYPLMEPWSPIDEVTTSVTLSATEAYPTWIKPIDINITIKNTGEFNKTFSVTVYYENQSSTTPIGGQDVTSLTGNESRILAFQWNITGIEPCPFNYSSGRYLPYTITVNVSSPILGKMKIEGGNLTVRFPGDANGDGWATGSDLAILGRAWYKSYGEVGYDWRADWNGDGQCTGSDLAILGRNWYKQAKPA